MLRSSEKTRSVSSCTFADQIAQVVLDAYEAHCPSCLRDNYRQTVLAGYVLVYRPWQGMDVDRSTTFMKCVSAAVGTKTIDHTVLEFLKTNQGISVSSESHEKEASGVGNTRKRSASCLSGSANTNIDVVHDACPVVRDGHAEVLARRGLQRWLFDQAKQLLTSDADMQSDEEPCYVTYTNNYCNAKDASHEGENMIYSKELRPFLSLKRGFSLHLYTSSAPCGNSCIKRWVKGTSIRRYFGTNGTNDDIELPLYCWPQPVVGNTTSGEYITDDNDDMGKEGRGVKLEMCPKQYHPQLHLSAYADGQVALTAKKCTTDTGKETLVSAQVDYLPSSIVFTGTGNSHRTDAGAARDWWEDYSGVFMSCSDKILLCNHVGHQGGLLANIYSTADSRDADGIGVASITIGRKYSEEVCKRALCCRFNCSGKAMRHMTVEPNVHHPAILCTALKFDHGVLGADGADGELQASFDEKRVWVCWQVSGTERYEGEVLLDGYVVPTGKNDDKQSTVDASTEDRISAVSSRSFAEAYLDLHSLIGPASSRLSSLVQPTRYHHLKHSGYLARRAALKRTLAYRQPKTSKKQGKEKEKKEGGEKTGSSPQPGEWLGYYRYLNY